MDVANCDGTIDCPHHGDGDCRENTLTGEIEYPPFEPIELEVTDLVVKRRRVVIESPCCPNCGADLREPYALTLSQYEYSEQQTDILRDDWSGSDSGNGEDYLPIEWACAACKQIIAEGSEA